MPTKAGRVLSDENLKHLKAAHEHIGAVIANHEKMTGSADMEPDADDAKSAINFLRPTAR